mmetsp:Transcript_62096/g.138342  ORF Transcript_62096/g.138342 Transcript_62096/m.138342 type:complete len:210 (-) Transcript_62096:163-792(-)
MSDPLLKSGSTLSSAWREWIWMATATSACRDMTRKVKWRPFWAKQSLSSPYRVSSRARSLQQRRRPLRCMCRCQKRMRTKPHQVPSSPCNSRRRRRLLHLRRRQRRKRMSFRRWARESTISSQESPCRFHLCASRKHLCRCADPPVLLCGLTCGSADVEATCHVTILGGTGWDLHWLSPEPALWRDEDIHLTCSGGFCVAVLGACGGIA